MTAKDTRELLVILMPVILLAMGIVKDVVKGAIARKNYRARYPKKDKK